MTSSFNILNDTLPLTNSTILLSTSDNISESFYGNYNYYYNISYNYEYNYYPSDENKLQKMLRHPDEIVALIFGIVSVILNISTLTALSKTRGRLNTHFRFMISLAVSDIVIGFTVAAQVINQVVNPLIYYPGIGPEDERLSSMCSYLVIKSLNSLGLNICLLNLMGMAVDHFIAIKHPLHYNQMLNKQRSTVVIVILWLFAFLCSFSDFATGLWHYNRLKHRFNFCEIVDVTRYTEEYTIFGTASVTACVMVYVYTKIFIKVHSHRIPGEQTSSLKKLNQHQHIDLDCAPQRKNSFRRRMRRSNRALKTTLLILATFLLCWLPTCIYQVAMMILVQVDKSKLKDPKIAKTLLSIDRYLVDVLVLNSILDPIIYTIRLHEVKLGYKRLFNSMVTCLKLPRFLRTNTTQSTSFYNPERSNTLAEKVNMEPSTNKNTLNSKQCVVLLRKKDRRDNHNLGNTMALLDRRQEVSSHLSHSGYSHSNNSVSHSNSYSSCSSNSNCSKHSKGCNHSKKRNTSTSFKRKTSFKTPEELYY